MRQPSGIAGRPRVIGDPQVLQARGRARPAAISARVAAPSLQSVWQWNVPVRSPRSIRSGSRPASAASISPASSRSSGGISARPERLEQLGLGPAGDRAAVGPARAYSLSDEPAGQRPLPHRDIVRLRPGEVMEGEGNWASSTPRRSHWTPSASRTLALVGPWASTVATCGSLTNASSTRRDASS